MFFPVKRTVFSDGDVPQIDVSPVVSNRNQENRWLKIRTDTMDYTNIYRLKTLGRGGWIIRNSSSGLFKNNLGIKII